MKPHMDLLEAVALRNRLDLEFTINKQGLVEINQAREDITGMSTFPNLEKQRFFSIMKGLMHRYEQVAGQKYVFLGYQRCEDD